MTIKEVAEKFGISNYTIRYYEKEGMLKNVQRVNGIRCFSEENISRLAFVVCMRNAGVSVEALKKYIDLYDSGEGTEQQRKDILLQERTLLVQRIEDMQQALERLNFKIENYDKILAKRKD